MSRDHSVLGRELDLFDTSPLVGPGLPLWLPDGGVVRGEIERFALELSLRSGCRRVHTPVLAKRGLFERSGHWQKFAADMFPPVRIGDEDFVLRPANCPHHTQVYAARPHSYRDLPVRYAELGSMFRSELSGVLVGLRRVRQISLDDAHVFCRPDQVVAEVRTALDAIREAYAVLGLEIRRLRLSVRGPGDDHLGDDDLWQRAEEQLREALGDAEYEIGVGEAAFYGPKIDVQVADAAGREETLSTVQVDHVQPERFDLHYVGEDGRKHRPVMVHRALLSSMERLVAMLLERDEGRLPFWLAPVQLRLLPVSGDRHGEHARARRVPVVAVVGDAEVAADALAIGRPAVRVPLARVQARLAEAVRHREAGRIRFS